MLKNLLRTSVHGMKVNEITPFAEKKKSEAVYDVFLILSPRTFFVKRHIFDMLSMF